MSSQINGAAVSASLTQAACRWIRATEELTAVAAALANGACETTSVKLFIEAPGNVECRTVEIFHRSCQDLACRIASFNGDVFKSRCPNWAAQEIHSPIESN